MAIEPAGAARVATTSAGTTEGGGADPKSVDGMQGRLDAIQRDGERHSNPGAAMDKLEGLLKDANKALADEKNKPGGGDPNEKQKLNDLIAKIGELMETVQKQKGAIGGGA